MKMLDLEALINRTLIDILSDQILARIAGRRQSALVLFDGSVVGLEPAFRSLARLQEAGWTLTPIHGVEISDLTPNRLVAIGTDLALDLEKAFEPPHGDLEDMLRSHNRLILPTLSGTLAAKAAMGIADSLASRILGRALELGKPVLAARDACCPVCRDKNDPAFAASKSYRAMLAGHLERLASFGVDISSSETLASFLLNALQQDRSARNAVPKAAQGPMDKRILAWNDVKHLTGQVLQIRRDVIITPLAFEDLHNRNIRIERI